MWRRALSLAAFCSMSPLLLDAAPASPDTHRHAICLLYPQGSSVRGVVAFSQESILAPTKIACAVKGLTPAAKHGIHVHQYGDLIEGCSTAGPHFNPHGQSHGGPSSQKRHVGDLGNLQADSEGNCHCTFSDPVVSLYGEHSVVGRSVVVHAQEDDLGLTEHPDSLKTGNSGARVACGVIGLAREFRGVGA